MKKKRGISKQPGFLAAYVTTASVTKAAVAAGVERTLHYRWLEEDEEYRKAFERSKIEAGQALEDEAVRRAHEGTVKPVFYKGKPTGVTREYSDALLMKLLDGFLPDKYKRRSQVDVTKEVTATIKLEADKLTKLSDDELGTLLQLAKKIQTDDH